MNLAPRICIDEKGRAIGKGGKNLKVAQMLASRHTEIQSVSVA